MKEKLETPTCEITGLPLPIRMTEHPQGAQFSFSDYHHHFHPDRSPLLSGVSGRALRYSRGQDIPRMFHNRYHRIFDGPKLPKTNTERFRLSVLACAGVVPRQALDLSEPRDFKIVNLKDEEHDALSGNGVIHIESATRYDNRLKIRNTIGRFFAQYALSQNVKEALSDSVIEQFLDPMISPERQKELGNFILHEALGSALSDVIPLHQQAKQEGLIGDNVKHKKAQSVVREFFIKPRFADYHAEVSRLLTA